MTLYSPSDLWEFVRRLSLPEGVDWLQTRVVEVENDNQQIIRAFAAAGRKVGHVRIDSNRRFGWTVNDAARTLLLIAAGNAAWGHVDDLYAYGDTAERRGVLRALSYLSSENGAGLGVITNALSSNEPDLVVAALSSYTLRILSEDQINQATLKCVFSDIPLNEIDGLIERANSEMARMLARLAVERVAAGRAIADDIWPFVACFPPEAELQEIQAELTSPVEARRVAAERAMGGWNASLSQAIHKL